MTKGEQHIYDAANDRTRALVDVMDRHGIVNPVIALEEIRRAELSVSIGCALLMQESAGGHNVFGHDPTHSIPVSWRGTEVTAAKYLQYKARRGPTGHGGMQGVGPLQLTWYAFQDRADKLGGCHIVRWNMRVGFEDLAELITKIGVHDGLAAYNGVGAAAQKYAASVTAGSDLWHQRFKKAHLA